MSQIVSTPATVLRERLCAVGAERARAADKAGTHLITDLLVYVGGNWANLPAPELIHAVRTAVNLYGWGRLRQTAAGQVTTVVDQFAQEWQQEAFTRNLFARNLHQYLLEEADHQNNPTSILRSLANAIQDNPARNQERLIRDLRDSLTSYLADGFDDDSIWEDARVAEHALDEFLRAWNQ